MKKRSYLFLPLSPCFSRYSVFSVRAAHDLIRLKMNRPSDLLIKRSLIYLSYFSTAYIYGQSGEFIILWQITE